MARPRLTKEAIAFIVECRDNPKEIYTWKDIADLVADKFGIRVSFQAIAKNYQKYKDSILIVKHDGKEKLNKPNEQSNPKKPFFKPKAQVSTLSEPLFERDEETDLKDYFD